MKLELIHLAPYLPYGLQFLHQEQSYMLFNLELPHDQNPLWITGFNNVESDKGDSELISVYPDGCAPILRPLSDLKKVINQIHEEYNLIDVLTLIYPNTPNFEDWVEVHLMKIPVEDSIIEYCIVQKLFEWHFDVFGLIEKGLAIDINTIENDG